MLQSMRPFSQPTVNWSIAALNHRRTMALSTWVWGSAYTVQVTKQEELQGQTEHRRNMTDIDQLLNEFEKVGVLPSIIASSSSLSSSASTLRTFVGGGSQANHIMKLISSRKISPSSYAYSGGSSRFCFKLPMSLNASSHSIMRVLI